MTFGYVEDGLVSLAIPGTFLYFLFFGRIYALTGAFIVMIFEMITGDIATFGVIYVIVITAFGQGMTRRTNDDWWNDLVLVFYLLFRDTYEGGNCERLSANDTCMVENMCSFRNFEAWMTMVHFTMGEFDVSVFSVLLDALVLFFSFEVFSLRSHSLFIFCQNSLHCFHDSHADTFTKYVNRFDGQYLSTNHHHQWKGTYTTGKKKWRVFFLNKNDQSSGHNWFWQSNDLVHLNNDLIIKVSMPLVPMINEI